jgi:hypothetical protein
MLDFLNGDYPGLRRHHLKREDLAINPEHYTDQQLVSASEIKDFIFCRRAWYLGKQGLRPSEETRRKQAAGIAFHEERAVAPVRAARAYRAAIGFFVLGALLLAWAVISGGLR